VSTYTVSSDATVSNYTMQMFLLTPLVFQLMHRVATRVCVYFDCIKYCHSNIATNGHAARARVHDCGI